jgi:hypothetical protein
LVGKRERRIRGKERSDAHRWGCTQSDRICKRSGKIGEGREEDEGRREETTTQTHPFPPPPFSPLSSQATNML